MNLNGPEMDLEEKMTWAWKFFLSYFEFDFGGFVTDDGAQLGICIWRQACQEKLDLQK